MKDVIKNLKMNLETAYNHGVALTIDYMQCKKVLDAIIEMEKKEVLPKKESKKIYGEYKHVRLTDKEYQTLIETYGQDLTKQLITYLDEYIEMKGYKAKNHYLCIRKWVLDAVKKNKNESNKQVSKKPAWLNKKIESNLASREEIKELEELLKEFE